MRKASKAKADPDMLPEYDFSKGVRGKYAARYAAGTNVILLEPDVAKIFRDSQAVNEALRAVVTLLGLSRPPAKKKPSKTAAKKAG
jgi:hypothetical protein